LHTILTTKPHAVVTASAEVNVVVVVVVVHKPAWST